MSPLLKLLILALTVLAVSVNPVLCGDDEHEDEDHSDEAEGDDEHAHESEAMKMLHDHLDSLNVVVHDLLEDAMTDEDAYKKLLKKINKDIDGTDVRVLVVDPDGDVVVDTAADENSFSAWEARDINENHADRDAIIDAIATGKGMETKMSKSTGNVEEYDAVRLGDEESFVGVLRASVKTEGE